MPAHITQGKCPVPSLLHPHPVPQASQPCAPLISTAALDSSKGTCNPLPYVSTTEHGQLLGTWSLKPTPIPNQHCGLGDSSQWRPFPTACFFVLPRGAVSQHHKNVDGAHSRPLLVSLQGREGDLWLSGSLTSATQSLPAPTSIHPSTLHPWSRLPGPQPSTVRGEA